MILLTTRKVSFRFSTVTEHLSASFWHMNTGIKFDNEQYYEKLKHDSNEYEIGDLILHLTAIIQYSAFTW